MALYIGLMSGTSLDGVDGVLAEFTTRPGCGFRVLAHTHAPMQQALHDELLALNRSGPDELHRAALSTNGLMRLYADTVKNLLQIGGVSASDIIAIGAHGQTVRHQPGAFDGLGYTWQLVNGALLAELCGIDTVCDFRSADLCAGGQGAPLVPAFHAACFARQGIDVAVLNLGGMANLTLLPRVGQVTGFDTGPGNVLMDVLIRRERGHDQDDDGRWAASGAVLPHVLQAMLADPYFAVPPPKSTGRDHFDLAWIERQRQAAGPDIRAVDLMATLAELTAASVAADLQRHGAGCSELIVCGGGSRNGHLMRRLQALLPSLQVRPSDAVGLPAEQVEALAFAWLAQARIERRPGNLAAVTGARGPRILGAIHAAPDHRTTVNA